MEQELGKGFAQLDEARARTQGELEQVKTDLAHAREELSRTQVELSRTKEVLARTQDELNRTPPLVRQIESLRSALRQLSPDDAGRVALTASGVLAELAQTTVFPELLKWVTVASEQQRELRLLKQAGSFQRTRRFKEAALRLPLNTWARQVSGRSPDIEIEVLPTRNPRSQGSEVWLLASWFTDFGGYFPLEHALFEPGTIQLRADERVPYGKSLVASPSARVQIFQSPQGARLTFLRHVWSGHVAITVRGHTQVIDLYSEQSDSIEVDLSSYPFSVRVAGVNRSAATVSQR
jgi:hypothetical protein